MLIRCIYTSKATRAISSDDIKDILAKARAKNAELDITGMLLFDQGAFFQVLEGPDRAVDKLYKKILRDKRHTTLSKVLQEPIVKRDFGDWTMGFPGLTANHLKKIPGLNDFFQAGKCLADMDEGRARTLLEGFREGKWRSA